MASSGSLYWLLPAAFVVHDAEELLTMPAWFATHKACLGAALSRLGLGSYADAIPTTLAQVAAAIAVFLVIFVVVTAGAWLRPQSFLWRTLYGGLLGAFLLHVAAHAAQALAFQGYTPGLVTAFVVVVPAALYIGSTLLRRGLLDLKPSALSAAVAFAIFPFAVLAALRLSHRILSL